MGVFSAVLMLLVVASHGQLMDFMTAPFRVAAGMARVGTNVMANTATLGAKAALGTAKMGVSVAQGAAEMAGGIREEGFQRYGSVEERAVKSNVGGGVVFGSYPEIENEAVLRGTYNGRPITVEDAIDAEMSGRFSGKGNIMEAAEGTFEKLSADRSRRDIKGVRIEGMGPEVMDVSQRVVAKGPNYGKIEFTVKGLLDGKFYEEFSRSSRGDVVIREIWNKDADSRVRSKSGLAPALVAKIHSIGTLGQARNIAKKIGQGYSGGMPGEAGYGDALAQLNAAKASCGDSSTGRSLKATSVARPACDLQKTRRLQARVETLRKSGGSRAATSGDRTRPKRGKENIYARLLPGMQRRGQAPGVPRYARVPQRRQQPRQQRTQARPQLGRYGARRNRAQPGVPARQQAQRRPRLGQYGARTQQRRSQADSGPRYGPARRR